MNRKTTKEKMINIPEELDIFVNIKLENEPTTDIRREIEECFTCWLEEKFCVNFSNNEHEEITEDALATY